jgi:hypothetical protein
LPDGAKRREANKNAPRQLLGASVPACVLEDKVSLLAGGKLSYPRRVPPLVLDKFEILDHLLSVVKKVYSLRSENLVFYVTVEAP